MVTLQLFLTFYLITMLLMVVLNSFSFHKTHTGLPQTVAKVSVLIPARNEAHNLSINLPLWMKVKYPELEICVLDDHSTDKTAEVVAQFSPKAQLVSGKTLPQGWLGKNWACQQLSEIARGDIFIFVDADVSPTEESITRTVATMSNLKLEATSVFLKQNFTHWTARSVIPWTYQVPIFAWAPLFLNQIHRFSSLAIGNGQWFAFTRKAYEQIGGHASVKSSAVEDMSLAKMLKAKALPYTPLLAPDIGVVTMYSKWTELQEGLTKNLATILGGNILGNSVFLFFYLALIILCFFSHWYSFALIYLCFVAVQWNFRQKNMNPVIAAVGLILSIYLLLRSIVFKHLKKNSWKGRRLG